MVNRKTLHIQDYASIMHPDDRSKIEWLNGLQVPYRTKWKFVKHIATHPFDHTMKDWYEIFKAGSDYYAFRDFLDATTSKYREAYSEVENQGEGINITPQSLPHQVVQTCSQNLKCSSV